MSHELLFFSGGKQNVVRWLPFEGYGMRHVALTGSWDDESGQSILSTWNLEPGIASSRQMGLAPHDGGVTRIALGSATHSAIQIVTASDLGGVAAFKLTLSADGSQAHISQPLWSSARAHAGGAATAVTMFPQEASAAASAGEDGRILVLSAISGQQIRVLPAEEDTVHCLASTGSCLLASGGRSVLLWDCRDPDGISEATLGEAGSGDAPGSYTSVAFDPTGTLVAAGSSRSVLSIWDVRKANARLSHIPLAHSTVPLWELAFPPTAARSVLLSASADGRLLRWDFASGVNSADNFHAKALRDVRVLADRTLSVNSLDPHPTEHQVVCVADDDSIQLVNLLS
jgi:WD40 repeat protein